MPKYNVSISIGPRDSDRKSNAVISQVRAAMFSVGATMPEVQRFCDEAKWERWPRLLMVAEKWVKVVLAEKKGS